MKILFTRLRIFIVGIYFRNPKNSHTFCANEYNYTNAYDRLDVFWQWIVGALPAPSRQGVKITLRQNVGVKTCLDAARDYFNSTSVFFRLMASENMSNRSKKVTLGASNDSFEVGAFPKRWSRTNRDQLRVLLHRGPKNWLYFAYFAYNLRTIDTLLSHRILFDF